MLNSGTDWSTLGQKCYSHYQEPYKGIPTYPHGISVISPIPDGASLTCHFGGIHTSTSLSGKKANVKLVNHQQRYFVRGIDQEYGAIYAHTDITIGNTNFASTSTMLASQTKLDISTILSLGTDSLACNLVIRLKSGYFDEKLNNFIAQIIFD